MISKYILVTLAMVLGIIALFKGKKNEKFTCSDWITIVGICLTGLLSLFVTYREKLDAETSQTNLKASYQATETLRAELKSSEEALKAKVDEASKKQKFEDMKITIDFLQTGPHKSKSKEKEVALAPNVDTLYFFKPAVDCGKAWSNGLSFADLTLTVRPRNVEKAAPTFYRADKQPRGQYIVSQYGKLVPTKDDGKVVGVDDLADSTLFLGAIDLSFNDEVSAYDYQIRDINIALARGVSISLPSEAEMFGKEWLKEFHASGRVFWDSRKKHPKKTTNEYRVFCYMFPPSLTIKGGWPT
jgi:type II secretory pathway pseudopilin PulG